MKQPLSYELIPDVLALPLELLKPLKIDEILYTFTDASGNLSALTTTPLLLDINFCKREFFPSTLFPSLRLLDDPGSWRVKGTAPLTSSPIAQDFQVVSETKEREAGLISIGTFSRSRHKVRDVFELYSHSSDPNIVHNVLMHRDQLEQLFYLFLDRTFPLRKQIRQEPLVKTFAVPVEDLVPLRPLNLPPIRRYFLNEKNDLHLTIQETQCVNLLLQCRSSTQIGEALGLSPRTVEHYINQVKLKLNCSSKSELYEALKQVGFRLF